MIIQWHTIFILITCYKVYNIDIRVCKSKLIRIAVQRSLSRDRSRKTVSSCL